MAIFRNNFWELSVKLNFISIIKKSRKGRANKLQSKAEPF